MNKKIALLLSGGVDSSVALHLLVEQGVRPDLFYIQIGASEEGFEGCPSEEDELLVKWLARKYDLRLELVNLHQEYWDYVVRYMIDTVQAGRTPHPDMLCNRVIKFGFFNDYWGKEYDNIATGHYASKKLVGDLHYLATAKDSLKDQTDFLSQITYTQLKKALFPIGELPKEEVRRIASEQHLLTAKRKDSQGICFLGKVNYNDFIERHLGVRQGDIIDIHTGRKIGVHKGYWFHTIGQRKGLGLSGGPWFVVRKELETNTLFVSQGYAPEDQYADVITLQEMNFISQDPFCGNTGDDLAISFKIRHVPDFTQGRLHKNNDNSYTLYSEVKQQGVAPGQFCTIYDKEHILCLGSAVISLGQRKE